ncbi:MAG: peptidoglycan DD-metalloendopeptidase family protein [Clostridia bacterium]|nr:peptidoglycan DD-metalloendopeptidase family protein [Clostridia bacterium]
MLQRCFQNIFIIGNIISICILPLLFYLSRFKNNYNIKHIYKIFLIISIILFLPIFNLKLKPLKNENKGKIVIQNNIEKSPHIDINHDGFIIEETMPKVNQELKPVINNSNHIFNKDIEIKNDNISKIYPYLPYIWISVSIILFIYNIVIYMIYRYKLKLQVIKNPDIEKYINNIKSKMKLKTKIDYAFSYNIMSSITIGILKKKIIIPIDNFEIKDYEYILKHEIFHIKNKDIEYKFLLLILNCIYWFNPITYFLIKQIDEIIELNCDYNILEKETMDYRIQYGNILLNQIEKNRRNKYKFVMNFTSSRRSIMERFSNIVNEPKKKKALIISIILIVFIITSLLLIIFTPNINIAKTETVKNEEKSNNLLLTNETDSLDSSEKNPKLSNVETSEKENLDSDKNVISSQESLTEEFVLKENTNLGSDENVLSSQESLTEEFVLRANTNLDSNKNVSANPKENLTEEIVLKANTNQTNFIVPVDGVISSDYGKTSPMRNKIHEGIDIAAQKETPIKASASGTVIYSGFDKENGNTVIIEHKNEVKTYYEHCSDLYVSEGQIVNQGDIIATVGNTGNSTGPHLHFEIRVNNEAVDPHNYIEQFK